MKSAAYAVIFTTKASADQEGYAEMTAAMVDLVRSQPGFLGMESAKADIGITISYWESLEAIAKWKEHPTHKKAQELGRKQWYEYYHLSICKIERNYFFHKQ